MRVTKFKTEGGQLKREALSGLHVVLKVDRPEPDEGVGVEPNFSLSVEVASRSRNLWFWKWEAFIVVDELERVEALLVSAGNHGLGPGVLEVSIAGGVRQT